MNLGAITTAFKSAGSLQGKTLVAAAWSLLGSGGKGVIRFVSNLILTRLLFPEAFGLMGTAMLVLTLVQVFSDTGIKTALIQHKQGDRKEYINTSFIIALVRSAILFAALLILIQPIAEFYQRPELKPILLIMSFAFLAEGLLNPALPLLIKSMRIEKQVAYSIGSQLAGFVTTLVLVLSLRSVNALALGYLMTSVYRVIISYLILPYLPRLKWDKQAGRDLIRFGKFIIINTMITWAAMNMDRFFIGKILGMEDLGQYSIALYIGLFLSETLVQVFSQSYFPAVSSIADQIQRVQEIYSRTSRLILAMAGPFLLLPVLFAQELIGILYDPRYGAAAVALFWIGLRANIQVVSNLQSGTLLALGKPALVTIANGLGLIALVLGLPNMTSEWGLAGAGIAILASSTLIGLIQAIAMIQKLNFKLSTVSLPWLQLAGQGMVMVLLHRILSPLFANTLPGDLAFMALMGFLALATAGLGYRSLNQTRPAEGMAV